MKKVLVSFGLLISMTIFLMFFANHANAPSSVSVSTTTTIQPQNFNKSIHSISDPGSVWWIINKVRPINPIEYAPDTLITPNVTLRMANGNSEMRLKQEASVALEIMFADAKKDNKNLMLVSGYRSYQLQIAIYNANVQKYGQAGSDKQSARPGTSEHQTGLAADVGSINRECELEICFADSPEGIWLTANAHLHGFIIRYPEGKENITGYQYEPWHLRYVGKELATEMHTSKIQTLEEFFDIIPDKQPY